MESQMVRLRFWERMREMGERYIVRKQVKFETVELQAWGGGVISEKTSKVENCGRQKLLSLFKESLLHLLFFIIVIYCFVQL